MSLTEKQLEIVCLKDQGSKTCRYLSTNAKDGSYHCLKQTERRAEINAEALNFSERLRRLNNQAALDLLPFGDNCDGYPISSDPQGIL